MRIIAPLTIASCLLSACVTDPEATGSIEGADPQPAHAVYDCDDGDRIEIANAGDVVRMTDADGKSIDLPASPPAQDSRYGEGTTALLLEGREAFLMEAGETPMTCQR